MTTTMRFKKGTMIYGKHFDIEFIGIIASDPLPDGRIQLDNPALKRKEWVNLVEPIFERESSFVSEVDVDLFDLLCEVKKQKGMRLQEVLQQVRGCRAQ